MRRKSHSRVLALALVGMVLALIAAGCGSSGSSSDTTSSSETTEGTSQTTASSGAAAGVAEAEAAVETGMKPITSKKLGPPVPAQTGKKVTAIMCSAQSEGCALAGESFEKAAQALGWQVTLVDGGGAPNKQSTAMLNAIAGGTDGIFLISIDRSSVSQGLAEAHAKHIPVVGLADNNTPGDGPEDVFAEVGYGDEQLGEYSASWIVAESGGEAKIGVIKSPDLEVLKSRWKGAEPVFESCTGCKIEDTIEYSLETAVNELPLRVKSMLLAKPDINYIWLDAGGFAAPVVSALQQLGRTDVKIATFDCVSTNFTAIRKGEAIGACAGLGISKGAWSAADQLNRAFAGKPASTVGDEGDIRLFDSSNLPDTEYWNGDFPYEANYEGNWGV